VSRGRGLLVAFASAVSAALLLVACGGGKTAVTTTTTTTTTLVPPAGSVEAVSATVTAFADAHRAGRDTEAASYFTDAAVSVCPTRAAFATALKGVREITSLVYQFAGVGPGYTEDRGVGTFEVELVEINPGSGQPYQPEPVTSKITLTAGAHGWLLAQPFPPNVATFC
jgi:hypothetical protein